MSGETVLTKDDKVTPVSDNKGLPVTICAPEWFDTRKTMTIANAPNRTASLEFSGADLNFVARVLYAESSGSGQLKDKAERDKEKEAIMNVNYFRLNRKGYPNNKQATTWKMVCEAPKQFESVYKPAAKLINSAEGVCGKLIKAECADLCESIAPVRRFMEQGPNEKYVYDNFRGYLPNGRGEHIGHSRFWLSSTGKALYDEEK
jgi:hypothetical protein